MHISGYGREGWGVKGSREGYTGCDEEVVDVRVAGGSSRLDDVLG